MENQNRHAPYVIKPFSHSDDIKIYLDHLSPEQQAEDDFLKASDTESSQADLYKGLLLKAQSILMFNDILHKYGLKFNGTLLEIGAGMGLLSAYIKKTMPDLFVAYSDVSYEAAIKSRQFEIFFNTRIDDKWITSAEDLPFADESFDNILFYASFHHVQDPRAAMKECSRVLKTRGNLFLLMEPSCPYFLKPLYRFHVKRKTIKENYYTIGEYRSFMTKCGLSFTHYNYKNFAYRWSTAAIVYYLFLNFVPEFLSSFFPCTQVIVGEKNK